MRYIFPFKNFVNEAIKFKLNDNLDNIINSIPNKKKAKVVENMLVKSIITDFYNSIRNNTDIDKNYPTWNTQQKLDYFLNSSNFSTHINRRYNNKLASIIDYINVNNINSNSFEELYQKSVQWHEDIAKGATQDRNDSRVIRKDETSDTDKFIIYPNGWYWINLNVSYSADEKSNMSHCGNDSGKILFSLRDYNSNSRVTASYNSEEMAMYQCKGRGNSKPKSEYHEYILDLLLNETYPINIIVTGSYKPELDFNLMDLSEEERNDLLSKKPSLEYTDNMFEIYLKDKDWVKVCSMIQNGFIYSGDDICNDFSLLRFIVEQKLNKNDFIDTDWFKPSLDLKTSKEDLEFCIENYNDDILNTKLVDEVYVLWKLGAISDADAESKLPDLEINDNKWFIKYKADSYSDLAFMYSEESMYRNSISYREFIERLDRNSNSISYRKFIKLFGNYLRGNDYLDYKLSDYKLSDCDLDDLTTHTKEVILDLMKDRLLNLEESDIDELVDSGNFEFESVEEYSVDDVIDAAMDDGDCLKTLLELDVFTELRIDIIGAYEEAQFHADESEILNTAIKPLKNFFGVDRFIFKDRYILLPFDPSWAMLMRRLYSYSSLSRILEYIFDSYKRRGHSSTFTREFPDYLEFNYPYNGFYSTVKAEDLNELVLDRIENH